MKILRFLGGVVAGVLFAFLIVQVAEAIVHRLQPPPAGANMQDLDVVKRYVASLTLLPLIVVLVGWLVGTFVGTSFAARIGRGPAAGYSTGALLLCAGVASAMMIPQPVWFTVASMIVYVAMTWLGVTVGTVSHVIPSG